ncbi:hypothetical protein DBZ36_16740 [Alginatibacterium sediminis]|uniref:Uncharacterized protein n=1 Tax=Alginatibacterium sediminis TaxID=2164068 RepID=A0A420E7D5_9ALTE|nr:hypothetical protein [Alginatibacterium sediminis]RKF14309.1 hypothetical protein DBZ36_16740 [Alginatibacterium sediminis]
MSNAALTTRLKKGLSVLMLPKVSALLAALIYGFWAYYSQQQPGTIIAIRAGAVQACFAFSSTLLLASIALLLLEKLSSRVKAIIYCSCALVLIPLALHFLNGTPNILAAMLPGLVIGHTYLISLVLLNH